MSSVNEVGESALSDAYTVLFCNVPSAPATVTLTSTATPTASITATWTAPTATNGDSVRGYRVYVDDGEGGDFTMVYDGSTIANVYTYTIGIDYVKCGVIYYVMVTAINSAGESSP